MKHSLPFARAARAVNDWRQDNGNVASPRSFPERNVPRSRRRDCALDHPRSHGGRCRKASPPDNADAKDIRPCIRRRDIGLARCNATIAPESNLLPAR